MSKKESLEQILKNAIGMLNGAQDDIPEERRVYFPARCPGVKNYSSAHDYGALTPPRIEGKKIYGWCTDCRKEYDRQIRDGERTGL